LNTTLDELYTTNDELVSGWGTIPREEEESYMATERKKYVISGEAWWFTPYAPDKFNEDKFIVTVCQLDKNTEKLLTKLGIEVKDGTKEDNEKKAPMGKYVRLKSDYIIRTVDEDKQKWPEDVLIGNGSKVNVVFFPNEWKFKNKTGIRGIPTTVQVMELVEYSGSAGGDDAELLDSVTEGKSPEGVDDNRAKGKITTLKGQVVDDDLNDDLTDILPD